MTENIVIIKINKLYRKDMSALELYETTRGIWNRKIESVEKAEYCLSVAFGIVVEVYKIDNWYPAGTIKMQTRVLDKNRSINRIEFTGEVAEENIRKKYIGRSVKNLYVNGEADPLKTFFNETNDINTEKMPIGSKIIDGEVYYTCPSCFYELKKANRCPECGQTIIYNKIKKKKLQSLEEWRDESNIIGANASDIIDMVKEFTLNSNVEYHIGTVDLSIDFYDDINKSRIILIMLFGKGNIAAIQPSQYYDYYEKMGRDKAIVDDFFERLKPFLSSKQKNKPYENIKGYYFIEYKTIVERKNEFMNLLAEFCEKSR